MACAPLRARRDSPSGAIHQEVEAPRIGRAPQTTSGAGHKVTPTIPQTAFRCRSRVGPCSDPPVNITIEVIMTARRPARPPVRAVARSRGARLRMAPRPLIPPNPSLESGLRPAGHASLIYPTQRSWHVPLTVRGSVSVITPGNSLSGGRLDPVRESRWSTRRYGKPLRRSAGLFR